jgi:hypothetical protein
MTIVGYGTTIPRRENPGTAVSELWDGKRRVRTSTLRRVVDETWALWSIPSYVCSGDSGGGIFLNPTPAGGSANILVANVSDGGRDCRRHNNNNRLDTRNIQKLDQQHIAVVPLSRRGLCCTLHWSTATCEIDRVETRERSFPKSSVRFVGVTTPTCDPARTAQRARGMYRRIVAVIFSREAPCQYPSFAAISVSRSPVSEFRDVVVEESIVREADLWYAATNRFARRPCGATEFGMVITVEFWLA